MEWIYFAFGAAFLWSGTNFVDKYCLDRYVEDIYDFMFFSTITSWFFVLGLILLVGMPTITLFSLVPIVLGILVIYSYGLYGKALEQGETSTLLLLFQLIPVFTLILGFLFLGQTITQIEFIAFMIVMLGSAIASFERKEGAFVLMRGFWWMVAAVASWTLLFLAADFVLERMTFWDFFIYDTLGSAIAGLTFFIIPSMRRAVMEGVRTAVKQKYGWFMFNNFLDFLGQMSVKKALAIAPSAGLVTVAIQVQSFFLIVLGIILTVFVPDKIKEDISAKNLIRKFLGAGVIFVGIIILFL